MKKNEILYSIVFELLWIAFAAILVFVVFSMVRSFISEHFYEFLLGTGFLFITCFRLVVWPYNSVLIRSVWIKLLLFLLNIPLFFYVMHYYSHFMQVFDDYVYDLPDTVFQHIHSGTDIDQILLIKRLTVMTGVGALVVIVLFELRIIWLIFKLRQLDRYISR